MTTRTQAPGPDSETAQLTAGLTADHAPAHTPREPEPAREHEPPADPEPVDDFDPDDEPEPGERPARLRALAMPDLRPYADPKAVAGVARQGIAASRKPAASVARRTAAGIAAVARWFWAGTRTLVGVLYGWLNGSYGEKWSIPARLGGVVLVLLVAVHTVQQFGTLALMGMAWAWVQAAVMTGRGLFDRFLGKAKPEQPKASEEAPGKGEDTAPASRRKGLARLLRRTPSKPPAEPVDQAPAEPSTEPPLTALIRELIGDDNGVHLSVLRPAMRERLPGLAEADDKQLRKVLVAAGFDPSQTFRARGVAGRSGVHRSQLPPLPSPGSRQEDSPGHSPLPESGLDLRKSSVVESAESGPESDRRGRRKPPEGWTEEEFAKGERWVNDPSRGPNAWIRQRLEDVE
ncbi:hypothetical protein AQJ11_02910 [Streptomyces corchorusii]|uniref:Uncharacterized protein n=2 Tax=Streptomyces TaxID=1883 RepID=A0A101QMD4_STRCK|nr:hypothetical protein [Streptomyces corchorusii]KUN32492.1 hypothetical protein AQJ11_02910 [Streptomyces corchorusii]